MTTFAAERLVIDFYNNLTPLKEGEIRVIEVSPTAIVIDKDRIRSTF